MSDCRLAQFIFQSFREHGVAASKLFTTLHILGETTNTAQTLNANSLSLGGLSPQQEGTSGLPIAARSSLVGCIEAPKFSQYTFIAQTPERLNLDNKVLSQRYSSSAF